MARPALPLWRERQTRKDFENSSLIGDLLLFGIRRGQQGKSVLQETSVYKKPKPPVKEIVLAILLLLAGSCMLAMGTFITTGQVTGAKEGAVSLLCHPHKGGPIVGCVEPPVQSIITACSYLYDDKVCACTRAGDCSP